MKDTALMLRSGRVAEQAGVSTDTLRHYERKELIRAPSRLANGYRAYPPETVDRVLLIRRALSIGFTIAELGRILKNRDRGGVPCREVRDLAAGKLAQLEQQLLEMQTLRTDLVELLAQWDARLSQTPDGQRADLLESLARPARQLPRPRFASKKGKGTK